MPAIYPSIASCRLTNIEDELARLKSWPLLHFDIEDGNFVPNITFGLKMPEALIAQSLRHFIVQVTV